MARPIEPTPTLHGEDAERLLAELEQVCSPKEAEDRIAWAKRERAKMMRRTNQAREYCDRLDGDGIPITPTPVTPAGGSDASQTEATEERESVRDLQAPQEAMCQEANGEPVDAGAAS
jgi:hypothetical protein